LGAAVGPHALPKHIAVRLEQRGIDDVRRAGAAADRLFLGGLEDLINSLCLATLLRHCLQDLAENCVFGRTLDMLIFQQLLVVVVRGLAV
jgi:hypothetical protein